MAYVTLDEFKRSPVHGIDYTTLDDDDDTIQDDDALQAILDVAEAWVNDLVGVSSILTNTTAESTITYLDKHGRIAIRPRNFPLTAVTSVKWRLSPRDSWTTVDLDDVIVDSKQFIVHGDGLSNWSASLSARIDVGGYTSPHDLNAARRIPITVEYTYTAGYATVPSNVKMAVIFYAAALIKRRGSQSFAPEGTMQSAVPGPSRNADIEMATQLLAPLRRVV